MALSTSASLGGIVLLDDDTRREGQLKKRSPQETRPTRQWSHHATATDKEKSEQQQKGDVRT
jgi:hypothetical protein